jgi:carbamate kinase
MGPKEALRYLKEGHFGVGSMRPKIEAAIRFLKSSGERVIITSPRLLEKALKGKAGTVIKKR